MHSYTTFFYKLNGCICLIFLRINNYHIIVWGTSALFALVNGLCAQVYGFWSVNGSADNTAICWIHLTKSPTLTVYPWLMFYIPLFFVFSFAVGVLVVAYRRLRKGISQTMMHRLKALVSNSINVAVYMIYWFVVFIFYILAFELPNSNRAEWCLKILLYLIASKGVFAAVVWILCINVKQKVDLSVTASGDGQRLDLNGALRQEVLHFATRGIRHCAGNGKHLAHNQTIQVVRLSHREDTAAVSNVLSPWFFICFIIGREKEREWLAEHSKPVNHEPSKADRKSQR